MKDNKELRALNPADLQTELLELRKKQFDLRFKKASGALDKQHLIPQVRKAIARVKTIISEKVGKSHVK